MAILKLFHVFVVFIWIGSLLMLSRLLAYQSKEAPDVQLRFGKILKRIYLGIDLPCMLLSLGLGLLSILVKGVDWKAPWLHMKLTFAFFLILCDLLVGFKIIKHSKVPIAGKGTSFKIFHSVAGVCFIGVLVAIYIFKQAIAA